MENIKIFKHEDFGEFKTTKIKNKIWFCLSDLCKPIELEVRRVA